MRACGTISGSARAHRLRAHSHGVEQTQIKRGSDVTWTPATVTRNDALNLDGSARLVHISVRDEQDSTALYRKDSSGSKGPARWLDSYTMAGQGVMLKLPGCPGPARMHSIASTPYESRRDSSLLSASLIEVVAERGASEEDAVLAELPPGSELEVSQVTGRGFTSLLGPPDALQQALELGRPLLCIAVGTQGMVPVRALLSWTPVLAHATNCRVTCLYATHTPTSAVFLPEWDVWREAGIRFQPLYSEGWDVDAAVRPNSDGSQHAKVAELLDKALFLREGGLQSLTVKMSDVIVLLGFPPGMGELASLVTKRLSSKGVDHDRILYANL